MGVKCRSTPCTRSYKAADGAKRSVTRAENEQQHDEMREMIKTICASGENGAGLEGVETLVAGQQRTQALREAAHNRKRAAQEKKEEQVAKGARLMEAEVEVKQEVSHIDTSTFFAALLLALPLSNTGMLPAKMSLPCAAACLYAFAYVHALVTELRTAPPTHVRQCLLLSPATEPDGAEAVQRHQGEAAGPAAAAGGGGRGGAAEQDLSASCRPAGWAFTCFAALADAGCMRVFGLV